jgi:hypothetical protein
MNCAEFESLIALNVSGDVSVQEASRVQAHLNDCQPCRALAEDLSGGLKWLQAAHQEPANRAMLHEVRVRVMRQLESQQRRWDHPFGGLAVLGWGWRWVAVSAAAAVLLGGLAWWSRTHEPSRTTVATARPVDTVESPPAADSASLPPAGKEPALESSRPLEPRPQQGPATPPARPEQAAMPSAGSRAADPEPLPTAGQIELVTAPVPESPEGPSETVMLKMPTSNPNIVVYWVVDDENQVTEDNKGD